MTAVIITEQKARLLTTKELIEKWGRVKALNQEMDCENALKVLTNEMKRRDLLD